jgi:hypothetical protein
MSEHGAAPAPAPKPGAPAAAHDPVEELAKQIFIEMSSQVHSQLDGKAKPEHKVLVELSFRLAEAFIAGNFDFNTAARERREAKAKASVDVSKIEIDFGSIGKK